MSSLTPKLDLFFRNIDNEYKNIWYQLWWRYMPGVTVVVKWPRGWTEPIPAPGGGFIQMDTADPNDHYRPYMEKHIGRQGWDWDWRIDDIANDTLAIKLRRRHQNYVSVLALKWA
jgi:hypothetical protein